MKVAIIDKERFCIPEDKYELFISMLNQVAPQLNEKPAKGELGISQIVLEGGEKRFCCPSMTLSIVSIMRIFGALFVKKKLSKLEVELFDADVEGLDYLPRGARRLKYAVDNNILDYNSIPTVELQRTISRAYHGAGSGIGVKYANLIAEYTNINTPEIFICSAIGKIS